MSLLEPPRPVEGRAAARPVRFWAAGAAAAALWVGPVTAGATPLLSAMPLDQGTTSPSMRDISPPASALGRAVNSTNTVSTASSVVQLRIDSGLTWDQLGRLFGVSRRAVHMWASGKRMNSRNIELLSELRRMIAAAPGSTSDERRSWLFSASEHGITPIEQFMSRHRRSDGVNSLSAGYTPAGLLGITVE